MDLAQPLPTSPYPAMKQVLPAIMTSVARMIPSGQECLHPYRLSNLHLVTESLTLMAGNSRDPSACISYSLLTPVVVSSLTPTSLAAILCHLSVSPASSPSLMICSTILTSSLSAVVGSGKVPSFKKAFSASYPLWMSKVASPPSSTIMSGPSSPGQVRACKVHHQYSGRVSPFQANTAAESLATAAAAWSWVEKMLQEHHLTLAPIAVNVSMRTAVWMVMCKDPEMFTPFKGVPYSLRHCMRPGHSTSAISISKRPKSAWAMSLTL
mmetsp:Transcript_876/g.2735  ORF Transcript_876/g.2735 Transcript_876/m.2735 type:complete len:267 (+) Transcript_876:736-1536(+)